MAIPASYTEKTLAEYMHVMLGNVAKALDLHFDPNGAGDYAEAVNDALLAYGTDDVATITGISNIKKIRVLAVVCAWQHVVNNFAALYDFAADGASYNRSQLFKNAQEALKAAQQQAIAYDPNYVARIRKVDHIHDPYSVRDIDERSL